MVYIQEKSKVFLNTNHNLSIINYYNSIKNKVYIKGLYPRFRYIEKKRARSNKNMQYRALLNSN